MKKYYTNTKIFHFPEKINSLPENKSILPPIHVRIKPTNICNHDCYYCAYRVDNLQLGQNISYRDFIPPEKITEIIDDLISMNVEAVTFSGGGDPFCYPHLEQAVEQLADSKIKFSTLTNGSLLKGNIAQLFAFHAAWLRISIEGWDNASYSQYRQVKDGEFSTIIDNIVQFKKLRGPCVLGVSINVDHKNAIHLYDLIIRLKDLGADNIKVSPIIISNNGEETNRYHRPHFKIVEEQINRAAQKLNDGNFEIFNAFHAQPTSYQKNYTWCPYSQILPIIGADLNVYSCQDKAYNLESGKLGSLKNMSFKDFWYSQKEDFYKINPKKDCQHHCVANKKNLQIIEYLNANNNHLGFV